MATVLRFPDRFTTRTPAASHTATSRPTASVVILPCIRREPLAIAN